MATEIQAPNVVPADKFRIFLAGTIDMGESRDWQTMVVEALADYDVVLTNPRRKDWDSSWEQSKDDPNFREQVEWEQDNLESADFRIFNFEEDSKSPITFEELGAHIDQPGAVGCPQGFYRKGNVDIVCERASMPVFETLEELIEHVKEILDGKGLGPKAKKSSLLQPKKASGVGCDWINPTTKSIVLSAFETEFSDYTTLIFQYVSDGTDQFTGMTGDEEVDWEKPVKVYLMNTKRALAQVSGPGWELDPDDRGEPHIAELQKAMQDGVLLPPAVVDHTDKIIDGRHRIHAASRLGIPSIPYIKVVDTVAQERSAKQAATAVAEEPTTDLNSANSNAQEPAKVAVTDTPAFKSWFAGSEVVDAQGKPLVMYHATQSDIGEFRAFTHFGTQQAANDRHTDLTTFYDNTIKNPARSHGANIVPVYLSIKNALRLPDLASIGDDGEPLSGSDEDEDDGEKRYPRGWEGDDSVAMTLREQGIINSNTFWEVQYDNEAAFKVLEGMGYDGIVYENVVEDAGNDSWIVFRPNQVKSAIGNNGEFSTENHSITAAAKPMTETPAFKNWFSGSKIVDAEGNPQVVYHGTAEAFDTIDMSKGAQGVFWVTNDKAGLERGELGAVSARAILPLYTSIKNPAGWDEYEKYSIGEIKGMGYDGVVLPELDGTLCAIVFKANQVKFIKDPPKTAAITRWYHGTSKANAKQIEVDGEIKPGMKANKGPAPQPNAVYVTSDLVIAQHYADGGVVFEVDAADGSLIPDEDSLGELIEFGELNGNDHYFGEVFNLWWDRALGLDPNYTGDRLEVLEQWLEPIRRVVYFNSLKRLALLLAKDIPELAQQIIREGGKAAHIGAVKVLGVVGKSTKKRAQLLRTALNLDRNNPATGTALLPPPTDTEPASAAPNDPTEAPAFQSWFRESKVVGQDGKPLVVHHQTHNDFEVFDRHWAAKFFNRDMEGIDTVGIWFTESQDKRLYGPKNMDCYLSIQRPFVLRDDDQVAWLQLMDMVYPDHNGQPGKIGEIPERNPGHGANALRNELRHYDYDGIKLEDTNLDGRVQTVWIAFEPNQIKSASRNKGTFDTNNTSILASAKRSCGHPASMHKNPPDFGCEGEPECGCTGLDTTGRKESARVTAAATHWYHGTSATRAQQIRESGQIQPGMESSYGADLEPRQDCVYIASDRAIAKRYALDHGLDGMVFEVAVPDTSRLLPDEDSIGDALDKDHIGNNVEVAAEVVEFWLHQQGLTVPDDSSFEVVWQDAYNNMVGSEVIEHFKDIAENIKRQDPGLAKRIIAASRKAAHVGPLTIVREMSAKAAKFAGATPKISSAEELNYLKFYLNMSDEEKGYELARNFNYYWVEFIRNEHSDLEEFLPEDEDDYTEDFTPFKAVLPEFLEQYGPKVMQEDPAYAPSFLYMSYQGDVKNEWLIHFTDNADAVAKSGFNIGMDDVRNLGLTTYHSESSKAGGGYNFAFTLDEFARYFEPGHYGRHCVIFQAPGIKVWHYGDEERQVIFWGKDARNIIAVNDNDEWEVADKQGNILHADSDIRTMTQWVTQNWQLCLGTKTKPKAPAKKKLPVAAKLLQPLNEEISKEGAKSPWLGLALAPLLMTQPASPHSMDQKPTTPAKTQSFTEMIHNLPKDYKSEDVIDRRHGEKPSLKEKTRDLALAVRNDWDDSFNNKGTTEELEQELKQGPTPPAQKKSTHNAAKLLQKRVIALPVAG